MRACAQGRPRPKQEEMRERGSGYDVHGGVRGGSRTKLCKGERGMRPKIYFFPDIMRVLTREERAAAARGAAASSAPKSGSARESVSVQTEDANGRTDGEGIETDPKAELNQSRARKWPNYRDEIRLGT